MSSPGAILPLSCCRSPHLPVERPLSPPIISSPFSAVSHVRPGVTTGEGDADWTVFACRAEPSLLSISQAEVGPRAVVLWPK